MYVSCLAGERVNQVLQFTEFPFFHDRIGFFEYGFQRFIRFLDSWNSHKKSYAVTRIHNWKVNEHDPAIATVHNSKILDRIQSFCKKSENFHQQYQKTMLLISFISFSNFSGG